MHVARLEDGPVDTTQKAQEILCPPLAHLKKTRFRAAGGVAGIRR